MSCKKNAVRLLLLDRFALVLVLLSVFPLGAQAGQTVNLAWSPNSDNRTAGYRVHYGSASHVYTQTVDVGNVTNAVITLPDTGSTYYLVATAYDQSGVESPYSNETTVTTTASVAQTSAALVMIPTATVAPAPATLTSVQRTAGQFSFTVNGTTGASYVVLASTNLVNWFPVQTNTAPFTFMDSHVAGVSRCFYRSVSQ
jgi:hypothetical protein